MNSVDCPFRFIYVKARERTWYYNCCIFKIIVDNVRQTSVSIYEIQWIFLVFIVLCSR